MNGLVCLITIATAILGLICILIFAMPKDNRLVNDSSFRAHRFKREASPVNDTKNCHNNLAVDPKYFTGSRLIDNFLSSSSKENFINDFISHAKWESSSGHVYKSFRKYIRYDNGHPEFAFSINIPGFKCYLNHKIVKEFKDAKFLKSKRGKVNGIHIKNILRFNIKNFIYMISTYFAFLSRKTQKSGPGLFDFAWDEDNCKFTRRCNFKLNISSDNEFSATIYLTELQTATTNLIPRIESSLHPTTDLIINNVDFSRIEKSINSVLLHLNNEYREIYEHNLLITKRNINETLQERVKNMQHKFTFEIFDGNFSIFDIPNQYYDILADGKFWYPSSTYVELENNSQKDRVEYLTFLARNVESYDITAKPTVEFQSYNYAVLISNKSTTQSFSKTITFVRQTLPEYRIFSLARSNEEFAELISLGNDENGIKEFKLRKMFFEALDEVYEMLLNLPIKEQ